MDVLKFEIEGFVNSMRYEFSRKTHKTFIMPPKTAIIGLIVNCAGGSINLFQELQKQIKVGVLVKKFSAIISDTWSYKLLENKSNKNTGVVNRERLYLPHYKIYITCENEETLGNILDWLKNPKRTSYLGQNDEMVIIKNVELPADIPETDLTRVDSSFYGLKIKKQLINKPRIIPLKQVLAPINYKFQNNKRIKNQEVILYDFYGVSIEVEKFKGIIDDGQNIFLY